MKPTPLMLAVRQPDSDEYVPVATTGPPHLSVFRRRYQPLPPGAAVKDNCFALVDNGNFTDTTYACVQSIKLYNNNAPFENDQWVLMGVIENQYLSVADKVRTPFFIAIALATLIGAASTIPDHQADHQADPVPGDPGPGAESQAASPVPADPHPGI